MKFSEMLKGIRQGWFGWPIDFDPVWVEQCTGFVNKE